MRNQPSNWAEAFTSPHIAEYRFLIGGEEYREADIQGTPVIEKPLMQSPCIGRCCTGTLTITIRPHENVTIPKAASVLAYCRLKSRDGQIVTDWVEQGVFWISRRSASGNLLTLTCRDSMMLAGRTYLDKTAFTEWPVMMDKAFAEIVSIMGIEADSRTTIKSQQPYMVDYPNEDVLMSEILSMIAAAHGGNFVMTETGKIRLVPFPDIAATVSQQLGTSYRQYKQLSTGAKTISRVTLTDSAGNQFTHGDDSGIELATECEYATQKMAEQLGDGDAESGETTGLIGRSFIPYELTGAYINPLIEVGDVVTIAQKGASVPLVATALKIRCNPSFVCDALLDIEDDDEDEVPFVSAAELRAKRYVVVNGGYFGNRINRTEGFVSEHIDANGVPDARAILNSGMLALQQKGADGNWIDCIYYDTIEKCYKISGSVTVSAQESSSSRVWIQDTAPEIGNTKDLWIDTTDEKNTPKRWDADTQSWVSVSDSLAIDAKALADAATSNIQSLNDTTAGLIAKVAVVESQITPTAIINAVRSTLNYTYDTAYGRNFALKTAEGATFVDRILEGTTAATSKHYYLSSKLYDLAFASKAGVRISFEMKRTNVAATEAYFSFWLRYSTENDDGTTSSSGLGYRLRVTDTASNTTPFVSTDDDWVTRSSTINVYSYNPISFDSVYFESESDMTGTIQIRKVKVEIGDTYTSWTPAPEDTADMITSIDSLTADYKIAIERITSAEQKITADAIVNTVRSSTLYQMDFIGGANLIRNGGFESQSFDGWTPTNQSDATTYDYNINPKGNTWEWADESVNTAYSICTGTSGNFGFMTESIRVQPGKTYTVSAYAAGHRISAACVFVYNNDGETAQTAAIKTLQISAGGNRLSSYTRIVLSFTVTDYSSVRLYFGAIPSEEASTNAAYFWITHAQLEEGTQATAYRPCAQAIEERLSSAEQKITADAIISTVTSSSSYQNLSNSVSSLETRVSTAEQKITADAIVSTVTSSSSYQNLSSSVTQMSNQITSKVSAGSVISTINQSAESVKIDATKIQIGAFTYGNANANGGLPNALYCGGQVNSTTTSTGLCASSADWAFWAGSGTFRVAQNGYVYAGNANIAGTLTAGSWTFNSSGSTYSSGGVSVNMTLLSGGGFLGGGSNTRAFYGSTNCDVQYGSDYSYQCVIRGGKIAMYTGSGTGVMVEHVNGAGDPSFYCIGAGSSWSDAVGNLGGASHRWDVGYIRSFNQSSSRYVKHDIADMPDMGDIIDLLRPVTFVYNGDESEQMQYGLIYEEAIDVFKYICLEPKTDDVNEIGIDYTKLITVLLQGIKGLRKRVATLEAKGA